jgi:clan AA aspartic protease
MGEVKTEITLVNIREAGKAQDGIIPESEVGRLTVEAVVDTGAWTLVINEETRQKLGLRVKRPSDSIVVGGGTIPSGITEYVEVRWKDRETPCEAVVVPNEKDILLGALPLEGLDLMIHPKTQQVIGAHGDKRYNVIK